MSRQLVVEVRFGLANRLRVVLSAQWLAEQFDRRLQIVWRSDRDCGARWQDLFRSPLDEAAALPTETNPYDGRDRTALHDALQSSLDVVAVRSCLFLAPGSTWRMVMQRLDELEPLPRITERVEAVSRNFAADTTGVHVRQGDFAYYLPTKKGQRLPALSRYFEHVDRCQGLIFLASDGGYAVERAFRRRYGRRLILHPKAALMRDSVSGVRDALIDLLLLRRCQTIVGTQHSSFTAVAASAGVSCIKICEAGDGRAASA